MLSFHFNKSSYHPPIKGSISIMHVTYALLSNGTSINLLDFITMFVLNLFSFRSVYFLLILLLFSNTESDRVFFSEFACRSIPSSSVYGDYSFSTKSNNWVQRSQLGSCSISTIFLLFFFFYYIKYTIITAIRFVRGLLLFDSFRRPRKNSVYIHSSRYIVRNTMHLKLYSEKKSPLHSLFGTSS